MSMDKENTYELCVVVNGSVVKLKWFRYYGEARMEATEIAKHLDEIMLDAIYEVTVYDYDEDRNILWFGNEAERD